jgi:protein AroM
VLIVYPSRLLQGVVTGLAQGRKLGGVLPAADQIPEAEASREVLWPGMEVFFTWASPYVDASMRQRRWERAARDLEQAAVDLVVLDCMGMDEGMKRTIQEIVHRPVVLPRMVVAQVADLML